MSVSLPSQILFSFVLENGLKGGLDGSGKIVLYDTEDHVVTDQSGTSYDVAYDVPNYSLKSSAKATILKYSETEHLIFWKDNEKFYTYILDINKVNYDQNGFPIVVCDNPGQPTGGLLNTASSIQTLELIKQGVQFNVDNNLHSQPDKRLVGLNTKLNEPDGLTELLESTYLHFEKTLKQLTSYGVTTDYTSYVNIINGNSKYIVYNEIKNKGEEGLKRNNIIISFSTYSDNYFVRRLPENNNGTVAKDSVNLEYSVSVAQGYTLHNNSLSYELVNIPTQYAVNDLDISSDFIREFGDGFSFVTDDGAGIYNICTNQYSSSEETFTKTTNFEGVNISTPPISDKVPTILDTFDSEINYTSNLPTVIGNKRSTISDLLYSSLETAQTNYFDNEESEILTDLIVDEIEEDSKGSFLVAYAIKHGFLLMALDATTHMFLPPQDTAGIEFHIPGGKWDTESNSEITNEGGWTPISMVFSPLDNFLYTIIEHPSEAGNRKLCIYNTSVIDATAIKESAVMIDNPFSGSLDRLELLPDGNIHIFSLGSSEYIKIHASDYEDAIELLINGFNTVQSYGEAIEYTPVFEPETNAEGRVLDTFSDRTTAPGATPLPTDPQILGGENNSTTPSFIGTGDTVFLLDNVSVESPENNVAFSGLTDAEKFDKSISINDFYTDSNYNKLFTIRQNTIIYRTGASDTIPSLNAVKSFIGEETYAFPDYLNPNYGIISLNSSTNNFSFGLVKFDKGQYIDLPAPTSLSEGSYTHGLTIIRSTYNSHTYANPQAIKIVSVSLFEHRICMLHTPENNSYKFTIFGFDARTVNLEEAISRNTSLETAVTKLSETTIIVPDGTALSTDKTSIIEVSSGAGDKLAIMLGDGEDQILYLADIDLFTGEVQEAEARQYSNFYERSFSQLLFSPSTEILYGVTKAEAGSISSDANKYGSSSDKIIKINFANGNASEVEVFPYGKNIELYNPGTLPSDFKDDTGSYESVVYDPGVTFGSAYSPQALFIANNKIYFTAGSYSPPSGSRSASSGETVVKSKYLSTIVNPNDYTNSRYAINAIDINSAVDLDPVAKESRKSVSRAYFAPNPIDDIVPINVSGCTDSSACNHNSGATINDGTCYYKDEQCDSCDNRYGPNQCGECFPSIRASAIDLLQKSLDGGDNCFKCCDPAATNYYSEADECYAELDASFPDNTVYGTDANNTPCVCSETACVYTGCSDSRALNYDSTATVSNTSECIYEDDYCVLGENGDLVLRDPDNYCGDCNDPDNSPIYPKAIVDGITICDCKDGDGNTGTYKGLNQAAVDKQFCDCGTVTSSVTTFTKKGTVTVTTTPLQVAIGTEAYGGYVARDLPYDYLIEDTFTSQGIDIFNLPSNVAYSNFVVINTNKQGEGTYEEALQIAANYESPDGFTGWRLPTEEELTEIIFFAIEGKQGEVDHLNALNILENSITYDSSIWLSSLRGDPTDADDYSSLPGVIDIDSGSSYSSTPDTPQTITLYESYVNNNYTPAYLLSSQSKSSNASVVLVRDHLATNTTITTSGDTAIEGKTFSYIAPTAKEDYTICGCGTSYDTDIYCDCIGTLATPGCGCTDDVNFRVYCDCEGTLLSLYYEDNNGDGYGYPNSDWPDNIHRFCEGTGIGYRPNGTPMDPPANLSDTNVFGTAKWVKNGNCELGEQDVCGICFGPWSINNKGFYVHRDNPTDYKCGCSQEFGSTAGLPLNIHGCCGTQVKNCNGECVDTDHESLLSYDSPTGSLGCNVCGELYSISDGCGVCLPTGHPDFNNCECPDHGGDVTKDCNGVCGGSASYDDCETCSGGNTGIQPNTACVGCLDADAPNYQGNDSNISIHDQTLCDEYVLEPDPIDPVDANPNCNILKTQEFIMSGISNTGNSQTQLNSDFISEGKPFQETIEHTYNLPDGSKVTILQDNIHYTSKCQVISNTQTKFYATCSQSNAENTYLITDSEGNQYQTASIDSIELSHFNDTYEIKPTYLFAVDDSFNLTESSVKNIFGENYCNFIVSEAKGFQTLEEVNTITSGYLSNMQFNGSSFTKVPFVYNYNGEQYQSRKVYTVQPLWDDENNQYHECIIDFAAPTAAQDQDPCLVDCQIVKEQICCDSEDMNYKESGECTECSEGPCQGPDPTPEVTPVCLHDDLGTATNIYTGPTTTIIDGVEYPLVEHNEFICIRETASIGGLYVYFVIDSAGLSLEDYKDFRWNITDSNNNIIQMFDFEDVIETGVTPVTTIENMQGIGTIAKAIVRNIPINTNAPCVLFNAIGTNSKIWKQSSLIIARNNGGNGVQDEIYSRYLLGANMISPGNVSDILNLTFTKECRFGCEKNIPEVFLSQNCSKTVLENVDGFTDFTIEVATSGTSQSYELSTVKVFEISSGNMLAEFAGLEPNSIYTDIIKFNNEFELGIEVLNSGNNGAIKYKITSEDGTIVINKTVQ